MAKSAMTELQKIAEGRVYAQSGLGRDLRVTCGISLREMAKAVGVDPGALSRWERGQRMPRAGHAVRWVDALAELDGWNHGR